MRVHFDKCFLNGELINIKDLDKDIRYDEDRLSYTSLKTLNFCPFKFFNETWEDIGLSDNDNSAHGTLGHYLMGEFIKSFHIDNFDLNLFIAESKSFSKEVITFNKDEARKKIYPNRTYLTNSFNLMYVTKDFSIDKFYTKIEGYLDNITSICYILPLHQIKNLYVETGIYVTTKTGKVIFGKADLIIEYLDDTYSIIDHKSSFITMYFESAQLKMYASILKRPVKYLAVYELSSGSLIRYVKDSQECLLDARDFINNGLKNYKDRSKVIAGEHCGGCNVNCLSSITDDEGYLSI